ncbi:MAG: carotenoid oxygenase family protein [Bacteroidota bacterium]
MFKTGSVQSSLKESLDGVPNEFLIFDRCNGKLLHRIPYEARFFFNHIIASREEGAILKIDLIEIDRLEDRISLPKSFKERNHMMGGPVRYQLDLHHKEVRRIPIWEGVACEMPYKEDLNEPYGFANYFQDTNVRQRIGICSIYDQQFWLPEDDWQVFSSPVVSQGVVMVLTTSPDLKRQRFVAIKSDDFSVIATSELPFRVGSLAHGTWFGRG